ncbi:MAG: SDR family oxidoreductase [Crocinitomicaceae bacterium]|nr:SDR family oxidoreductase [Crocinitomicaceae bacterium]
MKTILICGSSGGLGTEITKFFGDKEFDLALHYYDHPPEFIPSGAKTYKADLRNEGEIMKMIDQINTDLGGVDIVIHNAGISKSEISWKVTSENWDDTIAINLSGPFWVTKYVLPHMRENNFGRVIFMSSIVAQTGSIGAAAYGASKAGLIGLTKTLSKELANKSITVNSIALGYFNTGMINDVPDEMRDKLLEEIPLNELGDPLQLASLMEYIISDKAAYLTGQTLNLNGGLYS